MRPALRQLAPLALGASAAFGAACGSKLGPPPAPSAAERASSASVESARALLADGATLPSRAEVVAVADAVAIEATRAARPEDQAALSVLAAELRARLHRVGKNATDAREAIELAVQARGQAGKSEIGCSADLLRAELVGETAHDAATLFREAYVVSRRFEGLEGSACLARARRVLEALEPYRPSSDVLAELDASAASGLAAPVKRPASAAASGSAAAPPELDPTADVIVKPPADLLKGPVKVTSLDTFGSDKAARVVVHLSGPATFEIGELAADPAASKGVRVYVDLAQASAKGIKDKAVGGALERVRVGPQVGGTRVVLDLGGELGSAKLRRRIFYLPDPFRVVIDVGARPAERPSAAPLGSPRPVARVALDAGHGGEDAGAVGPTGLKEKDVTLDVAHRVATVLAHEQGITTLLTRDSDTFVPLELRTARANAFHADLFVSVHCNANPDGHGRGVVSYVFDSPKQGDDLAKVLLQKENGLRSSDVGDLGQLPTLTPAAVRASSRLLAELLQKATMASLGQRYADAKDLGVRTAGFYVLAGADMPAVLFETSFISNSEEEQRLSKADYRQKLADGILNAIKAYREGKR